MGPQAATRLRAPDRTVEVRSMQNSKATRLRVGEKVVESQDKALAVVQRLLREQGIRSRCHHVISLGLSAAREGEAGAVGASGPSFWLERFPPELVVTGPQGWREATVTVGERSGVYLLALRDGPGLQKVRQGEPEKVAGLIAGALGAAQ
ncbi:hypothetical protein GCM10017673_46200 [Streptosporangium violaceochromogenes]|nr:hypothetical protein GCM10017673_46200 [Streptosporangium violaceochromogenes]